MKKNKKLLGLTQVHGKHETSFKPSTLDQIWGDDGEGKYSTLDELQYKNYLEELNKTDLHRHASKIGIIPIDNRELLEQRLAREFKKHVNSYQAPNVGKKETTISKAAQDILKEGK
jgi:hypothetical protein